SCSTAWAGGTALSNAEFRGRRKRKWFEIFAFSSSVELARSNSGEGAVFARRCGRRKKSGGYSRKEIDTEPTRYNHKDQRFFDRSTRGGRRRRLGAGPESCKEGADFVRGPCRFALRITILQGGPCHRRLQAVAIESIHENVRCGNCGRRADRQLDCS